MEDHMATRLFGTLRTNRQRVIPLLVGALLLSGLFFSLFGAKPAQADYYTGCGYGYGSTQSGFGYGTGTTYGYGFGYGGTFSYGYGDQVCPITITTSSLPSGMQFVSYTPTSLTATGGTNTFTWTSSVLPSGLSLSSAGTLSGTPTVSGTFTITFTATDGNGQPATKNLTLTIAPFTSSGGGGGAGGGTTTTTSTTSTTTTTVAPTTTTTTGPKPKYCNLFAKRFLGFAVVGRGVSRAIIGGCFYAQPKVTSDEPGTRVGVLHDNGRVLVVRVTVPGGSKPGWHTLTIREPNGKICRVNYLVRILPRR